MSHVTPIPADIRAAYQTLKAAGICEIVRDLEPVDSDISVFVLTLTLPTPNREELPARVTLTAVIPHTFPCDAVEFFPASEAVRGFPHQDAESGKLCLPAEAEAPRDNSRLVQYVQWAREWLSDAANGTLLKDGDPYELPDFSRKKVKGNRFTDLPPILFAESAETFPTWSTRIGQSGTVEFAYCKDPRGIVTVRFIARDGTVLRRVPFSSTIVSHGQTFKGQWIILPNITVVRHRPPQTYNELFTICRPYDPAITQALRRAWAMGSKTEKFGVLLVGVPIPQYVAEQPSEIHWQPIVFTNKEVEKRKFRGKGKADEGRLWQQALNGCFKRGSPVLWTKSANLDHSRQYARGSLPSPTKDLTIAIIGCGALGSIVAEALARSGIRRLFLFDGDSVEFGNLNRHTLDGRHVGLNKATALARRLASANPLSTINGYNTNIPIPTSSDERSHRALHEADVIVDCSTDHGAFLWLSRYARSTRKRLASMFIDAHATLLTLVLSGQHTPCNKVFERLNDSIQAGTTPVLSDDYFGKPKDDESILPGAGCWHPTFPAHNRHIWILGCTAIDLLISWMQRPYRCDGHGILIRRSGTEAAGPSVEILWNEPYR